MKSFWCILILSMIMTIHGQLWSADLTVKVSGVRSASGNILLSVFNDASSYLITGRGLKILATEGAVEVVFRGLSPGTYALAVHHDEDEDGEMATNFIGIPVEGYGFSNNAVASFGPPAYRKAAFLIDTNDAYQRIHLAY